MDKFHKMHLVADGAIGALALGTIVMEELFGNIFIDVDKVFHICILLWLVVVLVIEKKKHTINSTNK